MQNIYRLAKNKSRMEMMMKRRKSILLLAAMEVFLISGCGAREEVPGTSSETFVQSGEAAKTENASDLEFSSEQEPKVTQMAPAEEIKYMDITHIFKPY